MRRELRRHPTQPKPTRGSNRPARMPRLTGTRATTSAAGGRRVRGIPAVLQPAWVKEVINELKKVQWPSWQETRNLTIVVVVVAALLGVFLGGLDATFNWIIEHTILAS